MLRRGDAESVDDIHQERDVLTVEIVKHGFLGFRRPGFARRTVRRLCGCEPAAVVPLVKRARGGVLMFVLDQK